MEEASLERTATPRVIVAIPVCNEFEHITACLEALDLQTGLDVGQFGIVLFLNNCTDGTDQAVKRHVGSRWAIRVIEQTHPSPSAGWARRKAMEAAADWLAEGGHHEGVLLTTDADSRVAADWVARNLAAIDQGADAVAGRIALDPKDAVLLPAHLHARGRLEAEYEALLTEIDARLDPQPGNPWPCHWSKSGATIAVTRTAYEQVGGMPDIPSGEDRAFVDAIVAHGFVVRHAPDIEVITSGRLEGRASGGVADTMKSRCDVPDSLCDARLERLHRVVARAILRRHARLAQIWGLRPLLRIQAPQSSSLGGQSTSTLQPFGEAITDANRVASGLAYRPIRPQELPVQIRRARGFLQILRWLDDILTKRPDGSSKDRQDALSPVQP